MPNWKKLIVSGSDANLNSLDITTELTASDALITNDLDVLGNITASGNISASGDLYTNNSLFVGNKGAIGTDGNDLTLIGNTAEWTGIQIGRFSTNTQNIELYGPVTASGNISASGDLYGNEIFADNKYYTNGLPTIFNNEVKTFFGISTQPTEIQGTNIELDAPVTASGNISASGDFIGRNFTGSSFTGSFVGDGSGLTGLNSGSWDGIFSGSAQITGSLGVTGSVLVDGNVGIGTTNPSQPLHVDLGTVDIKAQLNAIGGLDGMLVDGTNASYNLIGGNGDKYSLAALNNGDFRIYNEGGAGYALTLNNSGKLGIGATDPQEKLDIASGNIRLDDGFSIRWATTDANIGRVRIAGNEANDFLQFVTDNSEKMRLTNTGLGIGTTTPSQKLDVAGNISVYNSYAAGVSLFLNHSNQYSSSIIKSIHDTIDQQDAGSSMLRFYTNDNSTTSPTVALDLTSESNAIFYGNVGIGTTAPTEKLQVTGNISASGDFIGTNFTGSSFTGSFVGDGSGLTGIDSGSWDGNFTGIAKITGSLGLQTAFGTGQGGIFIKDLFAGGPRPVQTHDPILSLGTSTEAGATSTIFLGASATATDQDSKIEFNKSNNALSIYYKGQGTYREHVRFGDPGNSTPKSIFFGNVGIGVTSPSATLDVSTAGMAAKFVSTQNTGLSVQGGANSQDLAIFKNPGGITELVVKSTGNVGIGNNFNTPSERLEVSGGNLKVSNTGTPTLILNSTNSTGAKIQALKNGSTSPPMGELSWNSTTGINLFFFSTSYQTNSLQLDGSNFIVTNTGSERMRINSSGNVGIGTTSPSEKLEVAGNILANATNATVNIGSTISSTPSYGYANTAAGSLVVGGYTNGGSSYQPGVMTLINQNPGIGAGTDLGVIQFAGKDDATSGYVSTIIKAFTAAGAGTGNSGGGILTISTTSGYGNPAERFRINQNGNVGIGTTSPTEKLQVTGNVSASGDFIGTNFTGSSFTGSFVGDGSGLTGIDSGSWDGIYSGSAQITGSLGVTGSVLVDGNVGIGTTSPSYKLDVNGTARVNGLLTIPGAIGHEGDVGTSIGFSGNDTIALSTNGSTKLQINALGQTAITGFLSVGTDTFNSLSINSGLTGTIYTTNTNGLGSQSDISFRTGVSTRLKINGVNGNVGIGTTSLSAKLHVIDNAEQPQVRIGSDASNYLQMEVAGSGLGSTISAVGSGFIAPDINFNTNSTTVLKVSGAFGYVGIGTVTPSAKLEVNGNVKADTLIATDLTDGVIPYHRNSTLGLQDQKMFSDNTNIYIGPSSPPNYYSLLTVEGSGISTTDIEISGSLTYQEPTAASEFNGEIATFGTFIETPAAGDLICFNNSLGTSGWREANNSSNVDATGMLGIAVGTTPTSGILLRGFARSALYNTTNLGTTPAGKKLYIDSTNGLLTTVIPTSNYVRIVGYVVEADATDGTIYFCPDNTYIDI